MVLAVLLAVCAAGWWTGCSRGDGEQPNTGQSGTSAPKGPESESDVPRGYMQRLRLVHEGRVLQFGPFEGYYFKPLDANHLENLVFICINRGQFYTTDRPADARLYEGQARFAALPPADFKLPHARRINPVVFSALPPAWLDTRPEPRDEYRHFHSCYNDAGPVEAGFWLRHVALADFTYDMGGRVGADSVLHHRVAPGPDTQFATLMEFDRGPGRAERGPAASGGTRANP